MTSDAKVTHQQASWDITEWAGIRARAEGKSVAAVRKAIYDAPPEDRPLMVRLEGRRPRVIESYEAWKERTGKRWALEGWCKEAGVSPSYIYRLDRNDRPHRERNHIVESASDWWQRMRAKEEAVT